VARPATKLPTAKKLTARQIAFVKVKAENPTLPNYQAAMQATGLTNPGTAAVVANRLLKNDNVKDALEEALIEVGFTVKDSAKVLVDALKANKVVVTDGEAYESDLADHGIRVNAARTLLSLLGGGKPEGGGNTFNFNFGNAPAEQEPKKSFIDGN
jgi:hypothetical protein